MSAHSTHRTSGLIANECVRVSMSTWTHLERPGPSESKLPWLRNTWVIVMLVNRTCSSYTDHIKRDKLDSHKLLSSIETTMIITRGPQNTRQPPMGRCTEQRCSFLNSETLAFLCKNRFHLREPRCDDAVVRDRTAASTYQHTSQ